MSMTKQDRLFLSVIAFSFTIFLAAILVLAMDKNQPSLEVILSPSGCDAARALGAELRIEEFCLGYATEMTSLDFKLQKEIRVSRELVLGWRPIKNRG